MGVGILLAIPWSIAGERGAIVAMNAFAVLLVWAFDRLLETCDVSRNARVIGLLGFAVCLPMLAFASQIYPEVPGALALTLVLTEILRSSSRSYHLWVIVAGIIVLPWLHVRYLPYAVFLAALPWFVSGAQRRFRIGFAAAFGLLGTACVQAVYHLRWFGSPWPHAMWGKLADNVKGHPLEGILGLFWDQQYGLFWVAPIYLLWPLGMIVFFSKNRSLGVIFSSLVVLCIGPAVSHMWWGGWSVAGRMLMPIIPCLAVCVVVGWEHIRNSRSANIHAGCLLAISLGVSAVQSALPDKQRGVLGQQGQNFYVSQLERFSQVDLSMVVPRLTQHTSPGPMWGALVWTLLWLASIIWLTRIMQHDNAR
jgi:hypothetical protein